MRPSLIRTYACLSGTGRSGEITVTSAITRPEAASFDAVWTAHPHANSPTRQQVAVFNACTMLSQPAVQPARGRTGSQERQAAVASRMTVLGEIEPVWILSPQLREKFLEGAKFIGLQRLTETAS
jgi:hypothetical protein